MSGPKSKSRVYITRKMTSNLASTIDANAIIVITIRNNNSNKDYEYVMSYSDYKAILTGSATAGSSAFNIINELVSGQGTVVNAVLMKAGNLVKAPTPVAINADATATVAQVLSGVITSTSAAAVALTMPTTGALVTALLALGITAVAGTSFQLIVDNSQGSNTITITLGTGQAVATPAITGGATLTISTANKIGIFSFYFTSATTMIVSRIV